MKLKLFVFSVLLYFVIVTIEARRSGGGSRTSSHSPSRSRPRPSYRIPSRTHKTIPSVNRPLPKLSPPKKTQDKFLDAERKSATSNLKPLTSHGVKQPNSKPIGLEHLTPGKYSPSAPPIVSSNQNLPHSAPYVPSAPPLPGNQPSYTQPNMNPLHQPSAPPLPGNLNQPHTGNQYSSYPNPGYQNPFNTDKQHNQYPISAPLLPSYPNQPNLGNQYPTYPNPGQTNVGHQYPNPGQSYTGNQYPSYTNPGQPNLEHQYPNPGQSNIGNQYPSYSNPGQPNVGHQYPNPGQSNTGNQYPSYSNPGQPNLGHQYPNPGQSDIGNQYPGYPFSRPTYPVPSSSFAGYYPNQNSPGNQYSGYPYNPGQSYPNSPQSNPWYSNQQNPFQSQSYGNHYPHPSYPSPGYFVTANNGMYNQGSHYSPYPGYTGTYGNYGSSNRRSFIPIPIPIPIPMSFPTSWTSTDYDSQLRHRLLNKMLNKIEETNKNQTSLFVINNSTVTPCNKEEFVYGGVVNLTITTCTILNCTAVSMVTSFNKSGEIIRNNGMITMCLDENATVSTNYSGTALPKVSEVKNYWNWKCVPLFNQTVSFTNGTRIGQNTTFGLMNSTHVGQNITNVGLTNGTNIVRNVTEIGGQNVTRIDFNNGTNVGQNVSRVALTNATNVGQNFNEQPDGLLFGQILPDFELTNAEGNIDVRSSFGEKEELLNLLDIVNSTITGKNNSLNVENGTNVDRSELQAAKTATFLTNEKNSSNLGAYSKSGLENSTNFANLTLRDTQKINNLTVPANSSQICGIENCSTTVFCMPTIEDTCTDALNATCKRKMTSYKSCIRVKMCKSDKTGIDRSVTLNTTIGDYYPETNNLTERYELANLTVITYFPPVLPTFGNFTTLNGTNSTSTTTNVTLTTPLPPGAGFVSLNVTGNSTIPLDSVKTSHRSPVVIIEFTNSTSELAQFGD